LPRYEERGPTIAQLPAGETIMPHLWKAVLLTAALIVPVTLTPTMLRAADDHHDDHRADAHRYHDNGHKDDHDWNDHEDRAYRMWAKENHRKYQDFQKLKARDQQNYWGWRHNHSDALLKIDIR
jgi:hypothetical protein